MPKAFTLGIEEEFQIVDPQTRELKSHIEEMLAAGAHMGDSIKPELHRSVIEVGSPGVRGHPRGPRRRRPACAAPSSSWPRQAGVRIVAAGTHPISHWKDQEITDRARYTDIVSEMEDLARANLIFGLHVHVGIEDREMQIQIMNGVRAFLPHLLALSVNSPFWCGRRTGVKSVRSTIFKRFPRTQIPDYYRSWDEYCEVRGPAGAHRLHRRRQEDLVGRPAPRVLQHPRVPHLRRPLAGPRRRSPSRPSSRPWWRKLYRLLESNLVHPRARSAR